MSKFHYVNQRFRVSLNYTLEGNKVVYEEITNGSTVD